MPVKHSDSRPGEKLLMLYTLLMRQGEHLISLGDLAQYLSCSKQTTLRLLDQLEASGYGKLDEPVKIGRQHYYRLRQSARPLLNVGVEELAQLALCRNLLLSIMPRHAEKANVVASGETRAEVVTKGRIDYAPFQQQYGHLMQALRMQRVCRVTYKKNPRKEGRSFAFAPIRLITYHETIAFLGWEVRDRGPATPVYENPLILYLQRFADVKLTQRNASVLKEKSLDAKESCKAFGIMNMEKFTARIRFAPEAAAYVHDRQWSDAQVTTWEDDGSLILELQAQSPPELKAWVLSFGSKATVLSPDWLKRQTAEEITAMIGLYSTPEENAGD